MQQLPPQKTLRREEKGYLWGFLSAETMEPVSFSIRQWKALSPQTFLQGKVWIRTSCTQDFLTTFILFPKPLLRCSSVLLTNTFHTHRLLPWRCLKDELFTSTSLTKQVAPVLNFHPSNTSFLTTAWLLLADQSRRPQVPFSSLSVLSLTILA